MTRGDCQHMTDTDTKADFVISRVLDAPRDLVWKAFSDGARMKDWWGPKGFTVDVSNMDSREGGTFHYLLKSPTGEPMWGKFRYQKIVPGARMEMISGFSDAAGGITRHPMAPTWPLEMYSIFTFEDEPGGKTKLTVTWRPLDATPEEQAAFDAGRDSMRGGWGGTLDKLVAYLKAAMS